MMSSCKKTRFPPGFGAAPPFPGVGAGASSAEPSRGALASPVEAAALQAQMSDSDKLTFIMKNMVMKKEMENVAKKTDLKQADINLMKSCKVAISESIGPIQNDMHDVKVR